MAGEIYGEIHSKMTKIYWFKNYKEVKPHYSEEIEDNLVEGEIDNDENDEYIYYFLVERAPERSRGWNGGWGWVVER